MTHEEFFLDRFSAIYPYSHCVWRIPEASAQADLWRLESPLFDLGCGDGIYMGIMQERVGRPERVIGLDPLAHEIEKARKTGAYDALHVGTSSNIPLEDASVNSVFSNSVVEHIQDKEGTLKEVARILAPGGLYLFSAPTDAFLGKSNPGKIIRMANKKFIHIWLQSFETWKQDLEKHGLEIIDFRYTLTPENAKEWKHWLPISFLQHVPMKRFGFLPFVSWSRARLKQRKALLQESQLSSGGNIVILARKR
ncbi:hypothetical protein COX00_00785 [Candidatus Uhrbacteria bacterium CG22_combo_CG10-13_8_21_14_all_47_17]|uniref:Methyltransferase type 11 domain-containing protein n=1 Tax=Candidatus Uhrbacteria bacterium CG22_combo_CG10-13_8_21_14_all_47_17 TaxID=1975041 RepID=A0A2H0BT49_9BACT|nr:MAG: hypothetical protein COX00_00785 [Candidatus Uhrbacteria bacterium CG22_combo_CG10-13_8_21_14_all_47_17]